MRKLFVCRLRRHVLIIAACLAVFAGVAVARFWQAEGGWWLLVPLLLVLFSLRRHDGVLLLFLVGLCFAVGLVRGGNGMRQVVLHQSLALQKVTLVGQATDEAVYGKHGQLEVVLTVVRVGEPRQRLIGNVTVRGFGESMIYRGDTVRATGKWYPIHGNSVASISYAQLEVLRRDDSGLNRLRREFAAGTQSALPEPAASFALGLLIGQRTTLPEATEQQLREVGLTHIIAVSGYNLTVIVMACRRFFARWSKFQATAWSVALLSVFLLITGSSPPVVRASIISLLGIAAWYYGRELKPLVLLLVGAAVTVLANPLYLWGNVSWYLSFLAFFGVLVVAPLVSRRLYGTREPRMVAALAIESACATIMVLPYILYTFGQMSVVSLVANMLVVPLIPLAMACCLAAGLAGMLLPALSGWPAWPARWLLTYMLDIAGLLSRLPIAFVDNIGFSLSAMLVAYGVLGLVTLILWQKTLAACGR